MNSWATRYQVIPRYFRTGHHGADNVPSPPPNAYTYTRANKFGVRFYSMYNFQTTLEHAFIFMYLFLRCANPALDNSPSAQSTDRFGHEARSGIKQQSRFELGRLRRHSFWKTKKNANSKHRWMITAAWEGTACGTGRQPLLETTAPGRPSSERNLH